MPSPHQGQGGGLREDLLIELRRQLLAILQQSTAGISEHELLKQLRECLPQVFPASLFRDSLSLYRAHFLLFHVLYRLREELLVESKGMLQIDVLCIRLRDYHESDGSQLGLHDAMADYYLDLAHMENTGAEDVEELLGGFWARYYANSQRHQALAVLGLQDPVGFDEVTRCYRQLAMRHHPDRGGDAQRFAQLQQAMALLRKCEG